MGRLILLSFLLVLALVVRAQDLLETLPSCAVRRLKGVLRSILANSPRTAKLLPNSIRAAIMLRYRQALSLYGS